jgi:hypothetical protein
MKRRTHRAAFTLFELILAVALSAALLALVATAINLYLLRVDAGRTEVEEAQLARTILATIAADIRATTVYQTQDISSVAQLASSMADIDVDDLDDAAGFAASAIGGTGGSGGSGGGGSGGSGSSGSPSGGMGAGMGGSGQSGSGGGSSSDDSTTMLPGLNGSLNELYLDVSRLPRLDEMFAGAPAPAAAGVAAGPKPSDAKTVRYFVRQGEAVEASDPAATMLSPEAQMRVGGLVRQTVDQAIRSAAEQTGNTALLDSGQVLLAPEVTAIEFSYFDGTAAVAAWDMRELETLPPAVEVRIWMTSTGSADAVGATTSAGVAMPGTRMYSQTVELPLALATGSATSASGDESSTSGTDSGASGLGGTSP